MLKESKIGANGLLFLSEKNESSNSKGLQKYIVNAGNLKIYEVFLTYLPKTAAECMT